MTLRVLVCGGRDYDDQVRLGQALDELHASRSIGVVIHGAARGADSLAGEWARSRGIPEVPFPADWKRYRAAAGPIRNQQMLDEGKPALVVAFPGGTGTADMVGRARSTGIEILSIAP